jgi:hypothetical protein
MHHIDLAQRHAQLVGDELGEGGLVPLPWLCAPVSTVTLPVGWTRMVPTS